MCCDPSTRAAVIVLEPIVQADLQPGQYAHRPGRSARDSVQQVQALMMAEHMEVIDASLVGAPPRRLVCLRVKSHYPSTADRMGK
jgi:hypothetical protein